MSNIVEITLRGIDEATKVFDSVGKTAEKSMADVEKSVAAVDDSVQNVSNLDVDTGGTEQAMQSAESSIQEVEGAIEETAETGESFGSRMSSVFEKVADKWLEITAVAGGVGLTMEGFARTQGDVNATLDRTAIATGMTSDELREMAVDMADATTNTDQQAEAFEMLVQRGIDTEEQFRNIIPEISNLGTATGQDLQPALESADKLLKPFGKNLDDVGDNVDQMARIMMQTDIPLSALERNLGRVPDELKALEFGLDDAAAGIEVFRSRGFEGREAVRAFRRAVDESDGDMEDFLKTIGLTADEWEDYQKKVEPQVGLAEDIANANEGNMTVMEKLQENVSNLMVEYGWLAEVMGMLAPILISLGPIMKGVSIATGLFNAVLAANPIVLITAAIIGLIAVIALLWKHWDKVSEFLANSWQWIKDFAIEHFGALGEYFSEFWEWVKEIFFLVWDSIVEFITSTWEWISEFFTESMEFIGEIFSASWEWIKELFFNSLEAIVEFMEETWDSIKNTVGNVFNNISGFFEDKWNAIKDMFNNALVWIDNITDGKFSDILSIVYSYMNNIFKTIEDVWDFIKNTFGNAMDFLKSLVTLDFQGMKDAVSNQMDNIRNLISNVWNNVTSFVDNATANLRNIISNAFSSIRSNISSVWNGVKNTTRRVWDSMVGIVKSPINSIIGAINGMINGLNAIKIESPKIPSWVPKFGGKSFSIGFNVPNIPSLATGGVVSRPTLAMVGDAGYGNPEIVAPQKMIAEIVGSELRKLIGSADYGATPAGGGKIELVVPVILNGREIAKATVDDIDEELARKRKSNNRRLR